MAKARRFTGWHRISGERLQMTLETMLPADPLAVAHAYRIARYDLHDYRPRTWPETWPAWAHASPNADRTLPEKSRQAAWEDICERVKPFLRAIGYPAKWIERRCRVSTIDNKRKTEWMRAYRARLRGMKAQGAH